MKAYYNKLVQKFTSEALKDEFRAKGLKPVQHIDIYMGQDQNPENFEAFPLPALLVNWTIDHEATPPIATINHHLMYEQPRDTSSMGKNTDEALKALDLINEVDKVLQTIESETTGKLSLIFEGNKIEETITDVYLLDYHCSYNGKLPAPGRGYITAQYEDIKTKAGIYAKLLE